MRWPKIEKKSPSYVAKVYQDWRDDIAAEAEHSCVYCAISEATFGGSHGFHIEHFRPKSKFPELALAYGNLFYACCVCNVFKGNDWPNEPSTEQASYLDPSLVDYNDQFVIDHHSGFVSGRSIASRYVTIRLHLNRPQLTILRRATSVGTKLSDFCAWASRIASDPRLDDSPALLREVIRIIARIAQARESFVHALPYRKGDLRSQI